MVNTMKFLEELGTRESRILGESLELDYLYFYFFSEFILHCVRAICKRLQIHRVQLTNLNLLIPLHLQREAIQGPERRMRCNRWNEPRLGQCPDQMWDSLTCTGRCGLVGVNGVDSWFPTQSVGIVYELEQCRQQFLRSEQLHHIDASSAHAVTKRLSGVMKSWAVYDAMDHRLAVTIAHWIDR